MPNQQQITSNVLNDHFASPTFTKSVKVGSPELDQLISAIARDAEERRKKRTVMLGLLCNGFNSTIKIRSITFTC